MTLKLTEESQEHDLDLDNDPQNCIEYSERFINWSDLSDNMRKIKLKIKLC